MTSIFRNLKMQMTVPLKILQVVQEHQTQQAKMLQTELKQKLVNKISLNLSSSLWKIMLRVMKMNLIWICFLNKLMKHQSLTQKRQDVLTLHKQFHQECQKVRQIIIHTKIISLQECSRQFMILLLTDKCRQLL